MITLCALGQLGHGTLMVLRKKATPLLQVRKDIWPLISKRTGRKSQFCTVLYQLKYSETC